MQVSSDQQPTAQLSRSAAGERPLTVGAVLKRPFTVQTLKEGLYLISTLPVSIIALVIWTTGGSIALGMVVTVLGLPLLIGFCWLSRAFASFERARLALIDPRPLEIVYRPQQTGIWNAIKVPMTDVQTWKDFAWMLIVSLLGMVCAVVALSLWAVAVSAVLFPLWQWDPPPDWWVLQAHWFELPTSLLLIPLGVITLLVAVWLGAGMTKMLISISRACLGTSDKRLLRYRVFELEDQREASLTQQSTEMSRIERDLHDGAQARLVALAMDLGMAETKVHTDPAAARELIGEARDEAQRALQELRDLVRGIGPQILRDRGLQAALAPLAARSHIPVELLVTLPSRPVERSESAAYFVISEALTNAVKHSQATQIRVSAQRTDGWLALRITDNGRGGADDMQGEGLRGLRARVGALDGQLQISSPPGGPTIVDVWLPYA